MKKTGILNSNISHLVSRMGHTDTLTLADSGLPVPAGTERIDIALVAGVPSFLQTLEAVLLELMVEEAVIAQEMEESNPLVYEAVLKMLKDSNPDIKIEMVNHEEFKKFTKDSRAVIRTGECTPYANVILKSGVVF